MLECGGGDDAAARRSLQEAAAQEKRLDFVFERVGGDIEAVGQSLDAGRAAGEDAGQRRQVAAVLQLEAQLVDLLQDKGVAVGQ